MKKLFFIIVILMSWAQSYSMDIALIASGIVGYSIGWMVFNHNEKKLLKKYPVLLHNPVKTGLAIVCGGMLPFSILFAACSITPIGPILSGSSIGLILGKYLSSQEEYKDLFTSTDFQSRAGLIASLVASGHLALLNYPNIALGIGILGSLLALSRTSAHDWETSSIFSKRYFGVKDHIILNSAKKIIPISIKTIKKLLKLEAYNKNKQNSLGWNMLPYLCNRIIHYKDYTLKNKNGFYFRPTRFKSIEEEYNHYSEIYISLQDKINHLENGNEKSKSPFCAEVIEIIKSYYMPSYIKDIYLEAEGKAYCDLLLKNLKKDTILVSHNALFNFLVKFDVYWSDSNKCYKAKSCSHKVDLPQSCNEFINAFFYPLQEITFSYFDIKHQCPGLLKTLWYLGYAFKTFTHKCKQNKETYDHIIHYNEVLYNNNYDQNIHTKYENCDYCDMYWTTQDEEKFLAYKKSLK